MLGISYRSSLARALPLLRTSLGRSFLHDLLTTFSILCVLTPHLRLRAMLQDTRSFWTLPFAMLAVSGGVMTRVCYYVLFHTQPTQ